MYVPHRYYRRLLLPPGWAALGFLLLLGCQALLTHERQMRLPNVLQLTMPSLKPDTVMRRIGGEDYEIPYMSGSKLNKARNWYTADLQGTPLADFINTASTEAAVRLINAATSHAGGVRIRFHQRATYGNLVTMLDMMSRLNQKKYFLDIRYRPITLYAITDKQLPVKQTRQPVWVCGTRYYEFPVSAKVLTFRQVLKILWEQNWWPSMLLLVIISSLSIYRLAHPRPAIR